MAERASPELVGPEQGVWLARLDLEGENLLAAHAWCDQVDGGGELGLRLVFAVKLYMIYRGLLALLHRATVHALARPGAQARSLARCRALHAAGQLGCLMGFYDEARSIWRKAFRLRARWEIGVASAWSLRNWVVPTAQGDLVGARGYLEEALTLAGELGNKREHLRPPSPHWRSCSHAR